MADAVKTIDEYISAYEEYDEQLNLLNEISSALEEARNERNCVDFGINDIEIDLMGIINAISDNWYYVVGGMAVLVAVGMALMLNFIRKGELS